MIKKLLLPFTMLILSSCQVLMLPRAFHPGKVDEDQEPGRLSRASRVARSSGRYPASASPARRASAEQVLDAEREPDAGGVGDVAVAADRVERPHAVALVAAEAVGLGQVHPAEQVRVVAPARAAVGVGPGDELMDVPDVVDGALRVVGGAERGGGEEGARPLQPAPRVAAVVGVLRHRDHRLRVQRLQQQRAQAADEHRGVPVHPPDRAVGAEPAWPRVGEERPVGRPVKTRDPGEKRLAQAALQRARLGAHPHLQRSLLRFSPKNEPSHRRLSRRLLGRVGRRVASAEYRGLHP